MAKDEESFVATFTSERHNHTLVFKAVSYELAFKHAEKVARSKDWELRGVRKVEPTSPVVAIP